MFIELNDGSGTRNRNLDVRGIIRKIDFRQVEQGFSSFFAKFLVYYLKIFQSGERLVQLALNLFLHGTSETRVPETRVTN